MRPVSTIPNLPPLKLDLEGLELLLPGYFQLPSRCMSKYPVLCFGIQFNPIYEPARCGNLILSDSLLCPWGKNPSYFVYLTLESLTNPLKSTPR